MPCLQMSVTRLNPFEAEKILLKRLCIAKLMSSGNSADPGTDLSLVGKTD